VAVVKLWFEVWQEDSNGVLSISLCRAGPDGDEARGLLEPGARLVHTFEAATPNEALAIRNRLMGWRDYKPEPFWPDEPFTEEERRRQDHRAK
jgi:hypothetical protein